mmetsp:Transcript_65365/g.121851  ORF Transcript_65365/g.121851 Transcript_65365/m.121851 type:complete len:87 (-) Transcript_65365:67-327(-)
MLEVRLNVAAINKWKHETWSYGCSSTVAWLLCSQSRPKIQTAKEAYWLKRAQAARAAEEAERRQRAAARRQAGPVGKYVPPHLRNR